MMNAMASSMAPAELKDVAVRHAALPGRSESRPLYVRVLRFVLAAVLLATAIGKLLDNRGFAEIVATYHVLPHWALLPSALALALTELGLGVWLVWGVRLSLAALLATALHVVYFAWSSVALLRGLNIPDCGCFGVFWAHPLSLVTVAEDAGLALLAYVLFRGARRAEVTSARERVRLQS